MAASQLPSNTSQARPEIAVAETCSAYTGPVERSASAEPVKPKRRAKPLRQEGNEELRESARLLDKRTVAGTMTDLRGNLISESSTGHIHHPLNLFKEIARK